VNAETRTGDAHAKNPHAADSHAADPHAEKRIGEVWLTGTECVWASGPLAGRTLGSAWPELPAEWTGYRMRGQPRIPLLVKFIFPEDRLSVQVHPDDEYARVHESAAGGIGKTEMWYAVTAQEHAELRLGFEPNVTPQSFRRAIADGKADQCLRRSTVRAEDAFFVPAGTPHTIGPGMVLCEVQEHSDLTYRVYDYNRVAADGSSRPLHIRQAFEVLKFGASPESSGRRIEPAQIQIGSVLKTYLAACRHFAVERWQFSDEVLARTSPGQFELLVIIAGRGRIVWAADSSEYAAGQCWFFPAALGAFQLVPARSSTTVLRAHVPDLQEFERELSGAHIDPAARARIIHP
jgi:mannose-6-phosphate isomerase